MVEIFQLALSNGLSHPYQIKHSKRAKYLRIKLSNTGDLSIVLPPRTSLKKAHKFLYEKRDWIEKHLSNVTMTVADSQKLPEKLVLSFISEEWNIEYSHFDSDRIILEEKPNWQLTISGNLQNIDSVKKLINKWCQKKAKQPFTSMLEVLAEQHGFHYNRLSIRSQKTRWGSCSSSKNINLNSKLLFMTKDVVRYVMIHELCHTVEMNHSHRFWCLVEECDEHYRSHIKALKIQGRNINL